MKTEQKRMNLGQLYGKYGIFVILAIIFVFSALFVDGFRSLYNLKNVLLAIACTTTLAFGATFVIILGNINISYGSELAFIGCIACMVNVATGSVLLSIVVALIIGLVLGALTGFIITKFHIPAFIMTLALTEAARGGAVLVTKGQTIGGLTPSFTFIGQGYVGPIPMAIIIMLIAFAIMWVILNRTPYGRHVYAVGGNAKAAEASGINPSKISFIAYLLDGALVAISSLLLMGRLNSGVPGAGLSYEMDAITAVVVGGTSMAGGSGTLVGAIIVGIINNVQTLMGVDSNVQKIKCEVVCEGAVLNLPEPANILVTANASKGIAIHKDWSTRFVDAYNAEFQAWINATKEGRVDGPTAWDGYVGQVTAAAASKARDTQTIVNIDFDEMPDFYKR